MKTVVNCTVWLVVIWVRDVWLEVLTAEEEREVSVVEPDESVGVNVDVEKTVDSDCVGVTITEDVASVTDCRVVSEVAVVVVVEPPLSSVVVLFVTCRLNNAMASSRGSAATKDAKYAANIQKKMN